ncbi:MAG TPA: translation elongation factor 4 [Candidatus Bipolaricaulota bacterium]|nr:translation elongation factor 4 [Candidatus Bipolaricaulota bacterium]
MNNIRNFCIIAHIDHGKSTLADRLLELTGTVEKRKMKEQILDSMDLERERGITIKLQPAQMLYKDYILNLIDTPGHVDFSYEVSRSLAAVEGAILLVDATQGVQAQTLTNLYLALESNLEIIPVLNKIDLPAADIAKTKKELMNLIGCQEDEILLVSGKTGQGVLELLDRIIEKVPAPKGNVDDKLQALIFDSFYDEYRGVVAYIRVMNGKLAQGDKILFMNPAKESEALEVGVLKPALTVASELKAGDVGYVITALKDIELCQVGDTITSLKNPTPRPLLGYKQVKPMVYAGIFCKEGSDFNDLREAVSKLKLNDAALVYEPENSPVLGLGFRCGFLGLLHLEIFQERLRREFNLDIMVTVPSVAFKITLRPGNKMPKDVKPKQILSEREYIINNPNDLPEVSISEKVEEPIMKVDIISPKDFIGNVMSLVQDKRGEYLNTEYIDDSTALLHYRMPLAKVIVDFYDQLKTVSSGYASMNYELAHYESTDVVKLDILIAEEKVDAFSTIVYRDEAFKEGKKIVQKLKESIPRQMFVIKLQAAVGGKIIAAERISAMKKDVTANLYGGDWTRKSKLLEKQKKGKKKMMAMGKGRVNIPPEAFIAVLKR